MLRWSHPSGHKGIAEKLKAFEGSGLTQSEVARILDCSSAAVHNARKKTGISFDKKLRPKP